MEMWFEKPVFLFDPSYEEMIDRKRRGQDAKTYRAIEYGETAKAEKEDVWD